MNIVLVYIEKMVCSFASIFKLSFSFLGFFFVSAPLWTGEKKMPAERYFAVAKCHQLIF